MIDEALTRDLLDGCHFGCHVVAPDEPRFTMVEVVHDGRCLKLLAHDWPVAPVDYVVEVFDDEAGWAVTTDAELCADAVVMLNEQGGDYYEDTVYRVRRGEKQNDG